MFFYVFYSKINVFIIYGINLRRLKFLASGHFFFENITNICLELFDIFCRNTDRHSHIGRYRYD